FSKVQFELSSLSNVNKLIDSVYAGLFRVYRMSSAHTAKEYLSGLLRCEKGPAVIGIELQKKEDFNGLIERMEENGFVYEYLNNQPTLFQILI
ncbi:MAG: hypothetical protein LC658_07865, partial [Bacteroidales bacterium]|nr:hypothetical protein [Bacteroidales bacterium]